MTYIPIILGGLTLIAGAIWLWLFLIWDVKPFFQSSARTMDAVAEIRSDNSWNKLHIERLSKELATYEEHSFASQLLDEIKKINKNLEAIEDRLDSIENKK